MTDAIERLVNLALFFADARGAVTAEQARSQVAGYPADQDHDAFIRMFERDKDDLRRAGFALTADDEGHYRLDRDATYSARIELDAGEAAAIRTVGAALADDPSFPYAADLRLALAKISSRIDVPHAASATHLADEEPARQGDAVAKLSAASAARKNVTFGYTNSTGLSATHEIEPYGLFLHDGRWYLVGRDTAKDDVRTYTVSRMEGVATNPAAPKTPDFQRPDEFDIRRFVRLPFQFGPPAEKFEAQIRFAPSESWRAPALAAGQGTLAPDGDAVLWTVEALSRTRLLRFVLESGPGLRIEAPADLAAQVQAALSGVEALHG